MWLILAAISVGVVLVRPELLPPKVRKALGLPCCDKCKDEGGAPCAERPPAVASGEPVQPTVNDNVTPGDPYLEDDGEALTADAMEYGDDDAQNVDIAEVHRLRVGGGPAGKGDTPPIVDFGEYDV
jgi:hypothetical protein